MSGGEKKKCFRRCPGNMAFVIPKSVTPMTPMIPKLTPMIPMRKRF